MVGANKRHRRRILQRSLWQLWHTEHSGSMAEGRCDIPVESSALLGVWVALCSRSLLGKQPAALSPQPHSTNQATQSIQDAVMALRSSCHSRRVP